MNTCALKKFVRKTASGAFEIAALVAVACTVFIGGGYGIAYLYSLLPDGGKAVVAVLLLVFCVCVIIHGAIKDGRKLWRKCVDECNNEGRE